VLAGVVASGAVTIATERIRHRWQQDARREQQHRRSGQAVAEARREAYARYLVAQHVVEALLKEVPRSAQETLTEALQEHYASRRSSPDSAVWIESGAAEMHARLLAGDLVFDAIDDFEA
jgi:RimJ/RimL family protein N-acetyltransferase